MTAPTALAITATDLERYDDEIAGREILHRAADFDDPTGSFVAQCERPGQAGLAADDDEIDIAARYRKRLHQRIALVEQFWLRHVPPLDGAAADIGKLPHRALSPHSAGTVQKAGSADKRIVLNRGENNSSIRLDRPISRQSRGHGR